MTIRPLSACFVLLATAALGDDSPLRFTRGIETPPRTREALLTVPLDSDVYAIAGTSLQDLRVLDAADREIGFILRTAQTTETRQVDRVWTARQPALRPLDSGGLEITLSLADGDPAPAGIRLVTPLDNFEQQVQVSSSADGSDWQPLADGLLFDYSRYMDVRNDRLALPGTGHRHFRLVIAQVSAEQESELLELTRRLQGGNEADRTERVRIERRPFRIDRVELSARQVESVATETAAYPLVGFRVEQDADTQTTHVVIDARRQPLTAFRVESPDRNFSRAVRVEVEVITGRESHWQPLAGGRLTRFDLGTLQNEQLSLDFPETRAARYRLVIENRDSPPLTLSAVTARGPVQEVVFLAAADVTYRLAYGGELDPAQYDTAAIQAALSNRATPVAATLAAEAQPLSLPAPGTSRQLQTWLSNPWLLSGIIGLLVAVLGWGLYQAARRVDQLPPPEPPASGT